MKSFLSWQQHLRLSYVLAAIAGAISIGGGGCIAEPR
jgi:hypothetical protein